MAKKQAGRVHVRLYQNAMETDMRRRQLDWELRKEEWAENSFQPKVRAKSGPKHAYHTIAQQNQHQGINRFLERQRNARKLREDKEKQSIASRLLSPACLPAVSYQSILFPSSSSVRSNHTKVEDAAASNNK